MKIYSATNVSKFRIKWAESQYTSGNIDIVWGQLTDGNYFYASDADYTVSIVNENPGEEHNGEYDGFQYGDDYGWVEKHEVVRLSEKEELEFWLYLVNYCFRNNIALYGGNRTGFIKDINECLEEYK